MPCPNCGSTEIEEVESDFSDPNHHIEEYQCMECGTSFQWESRRTIVEEAPEPEFNKRLKEIQELRKKEERIRREEEDNYEDGL